MRRKTDGEHPVSTGHLQSVMGDEYTVYHGSRFLLDDQSRTDVLHTVHRLYERNFASYFAQQRQDGTRASAEGQRVQSYTYRELNEQKAASSEKTSSVALKLVHAIQPLGISESNGMSMNKRANHRAKPASQKPACTRTRGTKRRLNLLPGRCPHAVVPCFPSANPYAPCERAPAAQAQICTG